MGGNPPEFLYEKKVLSFTVFCFLSVHLDLRIFLFMFPGFLICLMVLGCLFIFKTEGLDYDYFRWQVCSDDSKTLPSKSHQLPIL